MKQPSHENLVWHIKMMIKNCEAAKQKSRPGSFEYAYNSGAINELKWILELHYGIKYES